MRADSVQEEVLSDEQPLRPTFISELKVLSLSDSLRNLIGVLSELRSPQGCVHQRLRRHCWFASALAQRSRHDA